MIHHDLSFIAAIKGEENQTDRITAMVPEEATTFESQTVIPETSPGDDYKANSTDPPGKLVFIVNDYSR